MFVIAGFLLLSWLGLIVQPLLDGGIPVLENTTTLVIQAMDLALLVPLAVLSGILLLRRSAWGYLLSSVTILKGITLGLGVSAMAVNMALKGAADSLAVMVPFLIITVVSLIMAVLLLKNVEK